MKKSEVYIGMEVTPKEPLCGEHFGRSYPQPICREPHSFIVQPGMRGIVAAIDVPCVFHTKGNPLSFLCVDFEEPQTGCRFRVRAWYNQVKRF